MYAVGIIGKSAVVVCPSENIHEPSRCRPGVIQNYSDTFPEPTPINHPDLIKAQFLNSASGCKGGISIHIRHKLFSILHGTAPLRPTSRLHRHRQIVEGSEGSSFRIPIFGISKMDRARRTASCAGVHIWSAAHRTTSVIGPSLRCGDYDFPHLHSPRINPNSLTDRARLVCYAALHA